MKVSKWTAARKKLKEQFYRLGIVRCEQCMGTFGLGFAHRLKRRFIVTDEELNFVALLCVKCHESIEYSGHANMFAAITQIVKDREMRIAQGE